MMQPAYLWDRDNAAELGKLNLAWPGRVAVKPQMSARFVLVPELRAQEPKQLGFGEHDHVLQTPAPDRADQPFNERVLPG